MSKRDKVSFANPPEPAFILRMKEQIGWKEGPNVDTKREERESADDLDYERIEPDDEKPAVVTLGEGDLTAEEAEELQRDLDMDDKTPGKFRFRKPDASKSADKRVKSAFSSSQSQKRSLDNESCDSEKKSSRVSSAEDALAAESGKKVMRDTNTINQRQLLSFADDDEEDS